MIKPNTDQSQENKPSASLPPDATILIEARIKAGEKSFQIKALANLILHDPVATIELLQLSNSIMFVGAKVTDLEAAITRIGSKRLIEFLSQLNSKRASDTLEVCEAFDILRYNCRRVSILSMIVAALVRPAMTGLARAAGLCADIGHMLALNSIGSKYCELAKSTRRKNLIYRLAKDHKFDLTRELVKYLESKGVPKPIILAYNLEEDVKNPNDLDLRCIVQAALELIEAHDGGKFENYMPKRSLPPQSNLRLLKILPVQQERLYKAAGDYLQIAATQEAPQGANLLISGIEEDEAAALQNAATTLEGVSIPVYPNTSVNVKSREALQDFFVLCEQAQDPDVLARRATEYLRERGLFERTALLHVDPTGEHAYVELGCGVPGNAKDVIPTGDFLSPFKTSRLEIRSTNVAGVTGSPFGVSAFALGPVDVLPGNDRLLLYADCSGLQPLSLESRRVFRLTLGLMMRSLQALRTRTD